MFGKLTIEIDKASIIAAIAFVGASFACLIISHAVILLIKGHSDDRWARVKGLLMLITGLGLFVINVAAVLRSDLILKKIAEHLESISL